MAERLLRMSGISKSFPGVRALDRVDLDLNASEGHAQARETATPLPLRSDLLLRDEPPAALPGREVDRLFEVIRSLRRSGVSVIYISHRLQEIKQVADRVTVLRDGRRIVTAPVEGITVDEIVRHMVGRALTEQYPKARVEAGKEVLRVEGLSKRGVCTDVSFSLRRGEVLR